MFHATDAFLKPQTSIVEPINTSSTTACQFVVDYSWYNFFGTSSSTFLNVYSSSTATATATAEFTYCQELKNTSPTYCSSPYYAAIYINNACALNSDTIEGTTTVDSAGNQVFTLLYSNTDSTTNNGVE